jgi:uncharacterized iron-regulated membrane protein
MRKIFFWTHLCAGTAAAIVILIMSVTGVLLTYERQMIAWADRDKRVSPREDAARLSPEALLASVAASEKSTPASLTIHSDPTLPAEAGYGRRIVFVDPWSGVVLGEGSKGMREFFHVVTDWHRWLAMSGDSRPVGRAITGASNLIFLFLALTGMYLWLPRRWGWQQVRAVLLFRGGLSGKARDFNWHNVIGIWSAVPLVFVILGALVISYPWATNLVYLVTGSEPPAAQAGPPPGARGASRGVARVTGLDNAWRQAEAQVPTYQSITWRAPASGSAPHQFSIAESHRGRPDKRSTLTVHAATGAVMKHETFDSYNTGRQWRMWLRFIHTGEALGIAGQTIAGLVSAGGAVLVWTGLALAWRRFRAWRARRSQTPAAEPVETVRT